MNGAPPLVSGISRPWWDALARGEVSMQHCAACDRFVFYPRPFCPRCGGRELAWRRVDGAASLYTWSVARVPVSASFAHLDQALLAVAELGPGIRVPTSLCDIRPEDISVGMALAPIFDADTYPGITFLRYRPA